MPLFDNGQLRKRWRYVGLFADELMLCAARAEVGPLTQSFWVLWDRRARRQWAHTALRPGSREVTLEGPRLEIDGPGLRASLWLGEVEPIETACPSGRAMAWTRKRVGMPVEGTVEVPGRRWEVAGRGVDDESAGHHRRHTSWRWSAGVGGSEDGRAVAWNLVEGINDPLTGSERAIWIDGEPSEGPLNEGLHRRQVLVLGSAAAAACCLGASGPALAATSVPAAERPKKGDWLVVADSGEHEGKVIKLTC